MQNAAKDKLIVTMVHGVAVSANAMKSMHMFHLCQQLST